jgi:hypothetical protein
MQPERSRARLVLIFLFLGIQLAAIAAAPFVPGLRFLAWAPFHEPATCRIQVRIDGRELQDDLVARRYGLPRIHRRSGSPVDWQLNDIRNVLEAIEAFESTAGRRDRAEVRVDFRRNGGKPEVWRWPPAP